jgi:hypothetical protein
MSMWRWQTVRRADIPQDLREQFELFGETIMALAIESGDANRIGQELAWLGQNKRWEIVAWLRERRDIEACHADRLEAVEVGILVFVVIGVILDLGILFRH